MPCAASRSCAAYFGTAGGAVQRGCTWLRASELFRRVSIVLVAISWYDALHTSILERFSQFTIGAYGALAGLTVALYVVAAACNALLLHCSHAAEFFTQTVGHAVGWALRGLVGQATLQAYHLRPDLNGALGFPVIVLAFKGSCILQASLALMRRRGEFDHRMGDIEADAFGLMIGGLINDWLLPAPLKNALVGEQIEESSGSDAITWDSFAAKFWPLFGITVGGYYLCTSLQHLMSPTPREALPPAASASGKRRVLTQEPEESFGEVCHLGSNPQGRTVAFGAACCRVSAKSRTAGHLAEGPAARMGDAVLRPRQGAAFQGGVGQPRAVRWPNHLRDRIHDHLLCVLKVGERRDQRARCQRCDEALREPRGVLHMALQAQWHCLEPARRVEPASIDASLAVASLKVRPYSERRLGKREDAGRIAWHGPRLLCASERLQPVAVLLLKGNPDALLRA
jgi:hypothetical protein